MFWLPWQRFCPLGASLGAISMDYGPFFPNTFSTLLVRACVRVQIVESSVLLPCFPWHACSFVHDGRRELFSRVPIRPVLGTCTRPCTDRGIVCDFALFSMARVQLRPRRASGTFFPVSPYGLFWVRVLVRVRIAESSMLLPCFPWHACSSVHDGRRELFCPCPCTALSGYVY